MHRVTNLEQVWNGRSFRSFDATGRPQAVAFVIVIVIVGVGVGVVAITITIINPIIINAHWDNLASKQEQRPIVWFFFGKRHREIIISSVRLVEIGDHIAGGIHNGW